MEERRKLERFILRLPATVEAIGRSKEILRLFTRDISADGAYFECADPLPKDTRVTLEIVLALKDVNNLPSAGAQIKLSGLVLRSEPSGMAVRFDERYRMMPLGEA